MEKSLDQNTVKRKSIILRDRVDNPSELSQSLLMSTQLVSTLPTVVGVNPTFPLNEFQIKFLSMLLTRKGQFMRVSWKREMKVRKGTTSLIEKVVVAVCRAGIEYDNREIVQEKRESGELPAENAGLPWGQWLVYPYVISHKGQLYIRLYPATGMKAHREFFLNGISARREEIEALCLASEFRDDAEEPLCFTVKLESIANAEIHT
jgi:hypothetical protein